VCVCVCVVCVCVVCVCVCVCVVCVCVYTTLNSVHRCVQLVLHPAFTRTTHGIYEKMLKQTLDSFGAVELERILLLLLT